MVFYFINQRYNVLFMVIFLPGLTTNVVLSYVYFIIDSTENFSSEYRRFEVIVNFFKMGSLSVNSAENVRMFPGVGILLCLAYVVCLTYSELLVTVTPALDAATFLW